jgi:hypothetical protein
VVYWVHVELTYGRWFADYRQRLTVAACLAVAAAMVLLMIGVSVAVKRVPWRRVQPAEIYELSPPGEPERERRRRLADLLVGARAVARARGRSSSRRARPPRAIRNAPGAGLFLLGLIHFAARIASVVRSKMAPWRRTAHHHQNPVPHPGTRTCGTASRWRGQRRDGPHQPDHRGSVSAGRLGQQRPHPFLLPTRPDPSEAGLLRNFLGITSSRASCVINVGPWPWFLASAYSARPY